MEVVVAQMRENVAVDPFREDAFRVSFDSGSPRTAAGGVSQDLRWRAALATAIQPAGNSGHAEPDSHAHRIDQSRSRSPSGAGTGADGSDGGNAAGRARAAEPAGTVGCGARESARRTARPANAASSGASRCRREDTFGRAARTESRG